MRTDSRSPADKWPTRRFVLGAGASLVPAALAVWARLAAAEGPRNLVVCLTHLTPDVGAAQLQTVTDAFHANSIPVSCVLDLAQSAAPPAQRRAVELALQEPSLFEVIADIGVVDEPYRYFQMRRAGEIRARVHALLAAARVAPMSAPVVSLFSRNPPENLDFPAFRSAGFVALLDLPEEAAETTIVRTNPEQTRFSGGIEIDPSLPIDANLALLKEALAAGGNLTVAVPLSPTPEGDSELYSRVAELLGGELDRGTLHATRPAELAHQLSAKPPATLAVVLERPDMADPNDPMHALVRELNEAGLEFTLLVPRAAPDEALSFAGQCSTLDPGDLDGVEFKTDCAVVASPDDLPGDVPVRSTILDPSVGGWSGMGSDARLKIPALRGRDLWGISPEFSAPTSDRLLLVTAGDVPTHLDRIALTRRLTSLADRGAAKIVTVTKFTEHVTAPDPILLRFQAARKRRHLDPPHSIALTDAERSRLQKDARLAWRYIERMTNPRTGLCPGAVQITSASVVATPQLTLWDLGSQIHGIAAASRLGLIPQADASQRIAKTLQSIPMQVIDDLRLPPRFMKSNRVGIVRRGFDFCDTGRFLAALRQAVDAGLVTADAAQAVFDAWDISGTLRDAHPFDHKNGRWQEVFLNHCTPYHRRGLASWGLDIASPYPDPPKEGSADYRMRLLHALAFIGPVGTEPPLLEATELGPSPATDCMTDILFDSQITSYEKTGVLKCVSETPLHEAPWFSYQGLRVDAPLDDPWVFSTPGTASKYQTPEFQASIEVINSKAAYLWAAQYPHPYTRLLLATIRKTARVEDLGFSPGVFVRSGEAMAGFSDVNTNGVILCAIAHILAPR